MLRAIRALIVFGVLAAILSWPAIFFSSPRHTRDASGGATAFPHYKADLYVHDDGGLGGVSWPAIFFSAHGNTGDASGETTSFTSYKADFDVHDDGGMDVVETLETSFPSSDKHGIFQFFDRLDASDPNARHPVEDFHVTRDG